MSKYLEPMLCTSPHGSLLRMGKVDKLSIFPTLNSVGNYVVDSHVDKKWGLVMYDDVRVRILSNTVNTMFLVMLLFIIKSNIKSNLKV